jgi:hypothetical protein
MTITQIHASLAQSATIFMAVLSVWAVLYAFQNKELDSNWFGAAVIGELLIVAQFVLGFYIYLSGDHNLPRPFLHILYAVVTVISLPAGYGYLSRLMEGRALTIALGTVTIFLTIVLNRTAVVASWDYEYLIQMLRWMAV